MTNIVTRDSIDNGVVSYVDKKGNGAALSAEGALFKGGAALDALKDMAVEVAFNKAANGKYRAAAEIMCAAFPSTAKAYDKLYGELPWTNKASMGRLVTATLKAAPGKNGYTKRQVLARGLAGAMIAGIPAFATEAAPVAVTVDA